MYISIVPARNYRITVSPRPKYWHRNCIVNSVVSIFLGNAKFQERILL